MPVVHQAQAQPVGGASLRTQRRVLVVDDDAHSRDAVARLLAEEGYETAVAADGEEATTLLGPWHPDLVLTDLNMPRLDGRGLLARVLSVLPGTPVIVLSARASAEGGGASLETMGAAGFLVKPVRVDELLARINDLIGH
jgi:two-component system response regulator MprA